MCINCVRLRSNFWVTVTAPAHSLQFGGNNVFGATAKMMLRDVIKAHTNAGADMRNE